MNFLTRDDIALARPLLSPPGDTLDELLDERGISQSELAERMGRPLKTINEIIKAKTAITADTAIQLERTLGTKADFWLKREHGYRLELAKLDAAERLLLEIEKSPEFLQQINALPLAEMERVGWVKTTVGPQVPSLDAVLRFFGVASFKVLFETGFGKNQLATASFRRDVQRPTSNASMAAWLRHGEREVEARRLPAFDKKAFEVALFDIQKLAHEQPADFQKQLVEAAAGAGVAVVFSQNLKGAPVSGAARWVRNTPLIQLSGRYKDADRFWFTVFHEAGHILLHGKKETFLDEAEGFENDSDKEAEADQFAKNWLIPAEKWAEISSFFKISEAAVRAFSEQNGFHPGIVVGRLQKEELLQYSQLNRLKTKIELDFGEVMPL